jgi:undecaprenyl diphosphate synthase
MDGNGRWAKARSLPRIAGHRRGALAVRRAVEAAPKLGIGTLTLYAFSSDNWRRPATEVSALMQLLHEYLRKEAEECAKKGVRISIIGRRDRLSPALRQEIEAAERRTEPGRALHLRIAVDYSARDAILDTARLLKPGREVTREEFTRLILNTIHSPDCTDVDLLIRTGGEQRLSDFLLWETAYAELYFTKRMWPDFEQADLEAALQAFHARERRFGAVLEAAAG